MMRTINNTTGVARYAGNFTPGRRTLLTRRFKTVPFINHLGMKIKTIRAGHVTLTMRMTENLRQYQGLLHGGAAASLADTAASFAALTIIPGGMDMVTLEMKGNYLASVAAGTIVAEANVLHMGRRTSVIECSLFANKQRLVWKGTFTCLHFTSELNISE